MSIITVFVGHANNNVIGKGNEIPWHMPADLKRFKQLTLGHVVIMGRKTFENIVSRLGGPLPQRRTIVISHTLKAGEGYVVAASLHDALVLVQAESEVFIAGGGQVYADALPLADKIYLTRIDADVEGDVIFPKLVEGQWKIVSHEPQKSDEQNPLPYRYITLERIKPATEV
ncbi:MAG TPA: dihydrofolate reductase [Candidatus Saccharimonadales bacterium]|nr:dihydrofolate reductase [Candidatus Saccharimonadales bacterium]